MSVRGPWAVLGIAPTDDARAIRRAYAVALKAIDPEADPEAFIALREARDRAMHLAESGAHAEPEPLPESPPESDIEGPVIDVDVEAIQTLHAMVLDPASDATPDAIAEQTARVLADPAMVNLDHSQRVEHFLADLIVQGTPRSDPMIDPVMAWFRWDAEDTAPYRPAAADWIRQRSEDQYFEVSLAATRPRDARLLTMLRQPLPPNAGFATAERFAARMENLLLEMQNRHPTIFAGLNQDTLEWWFETLKRRHGAIAPVRWLRRIRRRVVMNAAQRADEAQHSAGSAVGET